LARREQVEDEKWLNLFSTIVVYFMW
jgi:hypothetical protein